MEPGEESDADRRLAGNIRTARQAAGMTQPVLAARMSDLGFSWSQQTVTKVEHNDRAIRGPELLALAQIFGYPDPNMLMVPAPQVRQSWLLRDAARKVREVDREAAALATRRENAVTRLRRRIAEARKSDAADTLAPEIAEAERLLEEEVAHGNAEA